MKIITPWREWDIQSRNEEIDYAEAHHIPLKINRETNYSRIKIFGIFLMRDWIWRTQVMSRSMKKKVFWK